MAEGDGGLEGLEGLDEELDRLYGGPPGEFTAERDRLAKALRKDGQRERAAVVGRLRRPTRLAAALNAIARTDPKGLGRLIDASAALAEAQRAVLEGRGDAAGLRDAERAERDALEPLIAGAGEDAPALAAALRTGARSPSGRRPLRHGWLSREPEPDAGALFAFGASPPRQSAQRETEAPSRRPARSGRPEPEPPQKPGPAPDHETPARLERAKEALDAARAAVEKAEAEHAGAEAAASEAADAHRAAEEARDAARAAAEESARRAAEDAERAEAAAREAEGAAERAAAEGARARVAAERRDEALRALAAAESAARDAIAAAEGPRGR